MPYYRYRRRYRRPYRRYRRPIGYGYRRRYRKKNGSAKGRAMRKFFSSNKFNIRRSRLALPQLELKKTRYGVVLEQGAVGWQPFVYTTTWSYYHQLAQIPLSNDPDDRESYRLTTLPLTIRFQIATTQNAVRQYRFMVLKFTANTDMSAVKPNQILNFTAGNTVQTGLVAPYLDSDARSTQYIVLRDFVVTVDTTQGRDKQIKVVKLPIPAMNIIYDPSYPTGFFCQNCCSIAVITNATASAPNNYYYGFDYTLYFKDN